MSYNLYSMKHRPTGVTRRHHPAPGPRRTPGESGTGGMLKEVPCFVSKGQHSKRGNFEVQILRPRRTLDSRRRRGSTTRPGEAQIRSRVPYRPRCRAAAPRCAAPWRGAPGRAEAARRRVGAQRPVPAGSSTITAPCAPRGRPGRPARAARWPLPRAGGARFGTLLQRRGSSSGPESARSSLARAPASHRLLGLRRTRPPRALRSTLLVPRLQPQFLPNSQASVSHARPDCPLRRRLPKDRLPPRPPPRPPGAWLLTRRSRPHGVGWGRARPASPPGSAARRSPPRPLCARRDPLRGALLAAPPWAQERVKGGARDNRGTGRGQKALTLGRFRHVAAFGLPRGLAPSPASPPRQGGGEAEPLGPSWKWCLRSCREGAQKLFWFR